MADRRSTKSRIHAGAGGRCPPYPREGSEMVARGYRFDARGVLGISSEQPIPDCTFSASASLVTMRRVGIAVRASHAVMELTETRPRE